MCAASGITVPSRDLSAGVGCPFDAGDWKWNRERGRPTMERPHTLTIGEKRRGGALLRSLQYGGSGLIVGSLGFGAALIMGCLQ